MGDNLITGLVTIAVGIIGLATLAVILSKNAATTQVIQASGNALGSDISAAVSPITGGGGVGAGGWSPIGGNGV